MIQNNYVKCKYVIGDDYSSHIYPGKKPEQVILSSIIFSAIFDSMLPCR